MMSAVGDYYTKGGAIAHISRQAGVGRLRAEKALQRLADEGRIQPATFPHAILYSPEDVELVIRVLKGEEA